MDILSFTPVHLLHILYKQWLYKCRENGKSASIFTFTFPTLILTKTVGYTIASP